MPSEDIMAEPAQPTPEMRATLSALQMLMNGYQVTQLLAVAARLGIADQLARGPQPVKEVAEAAGANPDALYRALRGLAVVGVFAETSPGVFGLTPLAEPLRSDHPLSMRALILFNALEPYQVWMELEHVVRTGETGYERHFGMSQFAHLARHPDINAVFNQAMSENSRRSNATIVSAYDYGSAEVIVDVGGGQGALISAILRANPARRGVLFDQPHVIEGALPALEAAGVADRCVCVGGDFFSSAYPAGDLYTLRQVIHDWDDDHAAAILRGCALAMPAHGRVLVIEALIGTGADSPTAISLDLQMLVLNGGRQRTIEEYRQLYTAASLRLTRVIPTTSDLSIIEGERAE